MLKRVSSNPSTSVSAAPVCVITVFKALSQSVSNFVAYVAAATKPAPRALAAVSAFPVKSPSVSLKAPAFSSASFSSSPESLEDFPNCSMTVSVCLAASSKFASSTSVLPSSLFKALYCSSETSPFLNCSCTWLSAFFRISSFSLVSEIASVKRACFCANISVLVGSIFKSLFTSLSSTCVPFTFLSTLPRALSSFVVSPPISIVIPLILLFATS